jgi:AraC-like DNA-binding protein
MSRAVAEGGLRVLRGRSDGGPWELVYGACHPALAPYVLEYCGYSEQTAAPARRRELPAAQVVMIIDFGPTLRLLDATGARVVAAHPGGFIAGIDDGFTLTETAGRMEGMQVNFTPLGARLFLGLPMGELARQVVSLQDALGREGGQLAERLYQTRGWAARFHLLDQLILARLDRLRPAQRPPGWVAAAWDRIERSGGTIAIERLVDDIGYSRKHMAAAFRAHVGLPPKAMARLVRFQRALAALRAGTRLDLAQLALDLGYYDQAHFTREFRAYSGLTPGECLRPQPEGTLGLAA